MISVDENEKLHIYEDRTIEYDFLNYLSGKTGWRYIPCDIYNCSQIITGTRESHNYAVFWWSPISNKINGSDTYKLSLTIKLEERFWTCDKCGTYLDRDENAALNILKEGQRIFQSTVGNTESLGQYPSKQIDTGLNTNLESELLSNPSIEGPLL